MLLVSPLKAQYECTHLPVVRGHKVVVSLRQHHQAEAPCCIASPLQGMSEGRQHIAQRVAGSLL